MPATVTSITPRRAAPPPSPDAGGQAPKRPLRDNTRLILAGIALLLAVLVATGRARQPDTAVHARLPHRVRSLRAVGRRPDDARRAGVRAGAQHRQARRRAAPRPAVRAVPREAGGAAPRHDPGADDHRADGRQRVDPHQHRSLVQLADGGDSRSRRRRSPATTTRSARRWSATMPRAWRGASPTSI